MIRNKKQKKALTNNYLPSRLRFFNEDDTGHLDTRLKTKEYNKILTDPDNYFERVQFMNFDLIHNECRGDELKHDREYYETLFKKNVDRELTEKLHKDLFVSAAQRCERETFRLERDLQIDHFKSMNIKEQLKQKGIYLSSIQKRKRCTDECKSLGF